MTFSQQTDPTVDEAAVQLAVSVGNEAFEPGQTQVVIDATGLLRLSSQLEGSEPRRVEAQLDPERATQMIRAAEKAVSGAHEGKRYGLPDEPRYHFEIGEGEQRPTLDVWRSELPHHPELNRIVTTLQQIADEQGKGEIIL